MNVKILSLALCAIFAFSSCEKQVSDEDDLHEEYDVEEQPLSGTARLTVITRGDTNDPLDNAVAQGRIYIFNQQGQCVEVLSTDEDSNQATVFLYPGTYTLYAVGGPDLTRFSLPTKGNAAPTSVITLLEGKVMDDLLMKQAVVVLDDEEELSLTLSLDHKVLNISTVEIKEVPDDVTKVELSVNPLYSTIRLDGTYPEDAVETYRVALSKLPSSSTWKATPDQMLFPSVGTPSIKVSFTYGDQTVHSYSYSTSETLPANHHFTISGTYMGTGVYLTGILTSSGWGEDRTISFEFDETNSVIPVNDVTPLANHRYNGYFVVSSNALQQKAVLMAKSNVEFTAPTEPSPTQSDWMACLTTAMNAVEKPAGAIGDWRLPTLAESEVFLLERKLFTATTAGSYICLNDNVLNWVFRDWSKTPAIRTGTTLASSCKLRPVIDISY